MRRTAVVAVLFYALGVLTVTGCASFPWRWYATHMPDTCYDQGILLGKPGKNGWPDIPLSECKPDQNLKMKCSTVLIGDWTSLKSDDEKCHADLIACQKGPKP